MEHAIEAHSDHGDEAVEESAFSAMDSLPEAFYYKEELLVDPVVTQDGTTVERSVVARGSDEMNYYPNRSLKEIILETLADLSAYSNFCERPLPNAYLCPITLAPLQDPVIDPEGNTYERYVALNWISEHGTSPVTRTPLSISQLYPNLAILSLLECERTKPEDKMHPAIRDHRDEIPRQVVQVVNAQPSTWNGRLVGMDNRMEQFRARSVPQIPTDPPLNHVATASGARIIINVSPQAGRSSSLIRHGIPQFPRQRAHSERTLGRHSQRLSITTSRTRQPDIPTTAGGRRSRLRMISVGSRGTQTPILPGSQTRAGRGGSSTTGNRVSRSHRRLLLTRTPRSQTQRHSETRNRPANATQRSQSLPLPVRTFGNQNRRLSQPHNGTEVTPGAERGTSTGSPRRLNFRRLRISHPSADTQSSPRLDNAPATRNTRQQRSHSERSVGGSFHPSHYSNSPGIRNRIPLESTTGASSLNQTLLTNVLSGSARQRRRFL